jgi:hypothetical protein
MSVFVVSVKLREEETVIPPEILRRDSVRNLLLVTSSSLFVRVCSVAFKL